VLGAHHKPAAHVTDLSGPPTAPNIMLPTAPVTGLKLWVGGFASHPEACMLVYCVRVTKYVAALRQTDPPSRVPCRLSVRLKKHRGNGISRMPYDSQGKRKLTKQ
jgi:hypothetical protein